MSMAAKVAPPVSLVVRWPSRIQADGGPKLLARRLVDFRIGATWAIEEPRQLSALAASLGKPYALDAALLIGGAADADVAEKLARGLAGFDTAGISLGSLAVSKELKRGLFERALCQAGIRAVVGGAAKAKATGVRSLPFGIAEFRPHIEAPAARRWLPLAGISRRLEANSLNSPAVINIELSRAESSARSFLAAERLIEQIADAAGNGAVRTVTITQLAAELSRQAASRPQRSILRAAA
jgi:hypothetical protein